MSLYVHYDLVGTIRSFVSVNPPKGGGMMLTPKAGVLVAEVEGFEPKPGAAGLAALREVAKSHVVEKPQARCTLAKKP